MILAIKLLQIVIPVLFLFYLLLANERSNRQESLGDPEQRNFLSQRGIYYRCKRRIRVSEYRQIKLAAGLLASIIGLLLARQLFYLVILAVGAGAFLLGYLSPTFYFLAENQDDNRRMLRDLHNIYDTLRVYLAVDVFITDSLEECYRRVANKRLKTAIYELKEGLKSQSEQLQEIESFRLKFDNPHINQLANLLSQYYRSGNVDAMIADLSEQMVAIDHAINLRTKERMEMKGFIKEVLVLLGMLGGIAIALLNSIGTMMESMF